MPNRFELITSIYNEVRKDIVGYLLGFITKTLIFSSFVFI